METKRLKKILADHKLWLADHTKGKRANLSDADLSGVDLSHANLSYADLSGANLFRADLSDADLSGVDLSHANLSYADLSDANLSDTNLAGANLSDANLAGANLSYANLFCANLSGANLSGANLPSPSMVLLARWGRVSDKLCLELMRYDAASHPDKESFEAWAKGGPCPYRYIKVQRAANFREEKSLYKRGPSQSAFKLMVRLIKEKCKDSDYHN